VNRAEFDRAAGEDSNISKETVQQLPGSSRRGGSESEGAQAERQREAAGWRDRELERFDAYICSMGKLHFDRTDYSIVVKNRAPLPNSWRWEIYRAGRSSPIEQSSVYFHSVATANRAGKEALRQLLDKLKV